MRKRISSPCAASFLRIHSTLSCAMRLTMDLRFSFSIARLRTRPSSISGSRLTSSTLKCPSPAESSMSCCGVGTCLSRGCCPCRRAKLSCELARRIPPASCPSPPIMLWGCSCWWCWKVCGIAKDGTSPIERFLFCTLLGGLMLPSSRPRLERMSEAPGEELPAVLDPSVSSRDPIDPEPVGPKSISFRSERPLPLRMASCLARSLAICSWMLWWSFENLSSACSVAIFFSRLRSVRCGHCMIPCLRQSFLKAVVHMLNFLATPESGRWKCCRSVASVILEALMLACMAG
mmetsp:Transcript_7851/g.19605  ORF Transcript_7851/g.19605 Transcript_7851/m.19605 type:complete len:290 (-) Transcript_7851:348-1217(-)